MKARRGLRQVRNASDWMRHRRDPVTGRFLPSTVTLPDSLQANGLPTVETSLPIYAAVLRDLTGVRRG